MAFTYFSDRPAESDALGRSEFAKHLAKALLSVSAGDGMVVGIEGGWGGGKSTIIGFVKKELQATSVAESKAIIVDFNPWMVSTTGALVDALLTQLAASINVSAFGTEKAVHVGEKIIGYVSLLKHLKFLKYVPTLSFAGHAVQEFSEIANAALDNASSAGAALEDVKKLLPTLDLARRKAEVVDALRNLDRPIVVIVDDLDRLPAEEIRTVVQTIKAVADFPRMTYLLAYDRNVVASALGGGNPAAGLSYLEKIVQVAYPIPPLFEYQLKTFVERQLNVLKSSACIEFRDFETSSYPTAINLLAKLLRHPRDVIRLMNRLMLSLPATRNEVNVVDIMVFEALSQRFPHIRESVHRHPTDFTGHLFRGDFEFDDDEDSAILAGWANVNGEENIDQLPWNKHLPEGPDKAIARKACNFLFPKRSAMREKEPEDELHIADPDRLARYFRMMSLESVPEAGDIHARLQEPELLYEALSTEDPSELAFLLEWIHNYIPSCSAPNIIGSIQTLTDRALIFEEQDGLSRDLALLFANVFERLIRRAAPEVRIAGFKIIISNAPLSISETILLIGAAEQGKWHLHPEMAKDQRDQLVPDNEVLNSELETWSDKVRKSLMRKSLIKESRMHAILYRFAQLNLAYTETYAAVHLICSTEDGLKKFLSHFEKDSPFDSLKNYVLIEDSQHLADLINSSILRDYYYWLVAHITQHDRAYAIKKQASELKELDGPSEKGLPTTLV